MKVLKTIPFKCFDRAEYRSNVAETFVDILTIVPPMAYVSICFSVRLSTNFSSFSMIFTFLVATQRLKIDLSLTKLSAICFENSVSCYTY
jgi:hypothetical protein